MVTTFPADVVQDLQDFILWQPDATEIGVEAIYVMVSKPYGETNARGKYSGREYNTNKAGGPFRIWIGKGPASTVPAWIK
ncbi:S-type pyocin domain-containing protein [Serratia marcescens]|nr:S-type pyocin domain-containing protein [Serratia marcescens]